MWAGYIDDFDAFELPNLRAVGTGHDCGVIMTRGPQKSARDVGVAADPSGVCCTALHTKCDVLHFIEPHVPVKIRCMLRFKRQMLIERARLFILLSPVSLY